jgi:hypothetical protein
MTTARSPAPYAALATHRSPRHKLTPASPVTGRPDCHDCTWAWDYALATMRLKFVHTGCPQHHRLLSEAAP